MPNPLVSVVIPVFNGACFLPDAAASVQAQTYGQIEIIVVDDGSTDETVTVCQRLASSIHYLHQPNRGPAAARNRGVRAARGEYVAFLDVDDLWPREKLAIQARRLKNDPELDVILGRIRYVTLDGAEPPGMQFEGTDNALTHVHLGSGLFRRSVFDIVGMFDESLRLSEDHDWFLRAREKGIKIAILPEITLIYRLHGSNLTRGMKLNQVGLLKVLKRSLDRRRLERGHAEPLPPWSAFDEKKGPRE